MKKTSTLSEKLTKYSALSVAFVGVYELNGQSIVYTDIDPDVVASITTPIAVDLDKDGNPEFEIYGSFKTSSTNFVKVRDNNNTGVSAFTNIGFVIERFDSGEVIPDDVPGTGGEVNIASGFQTQNGQFDDLVLAGYGGFGYFTASDSNGYMGVKFKIGTEDHFGWVNLEYISSTEIRVLGYAYEETPNTPIQAGETGVLSTVENGLEQKLTHALNGKELMLSEGANNVVVYNTNGQQVLSAKVVNNKVSLASLNTGVYVVNATTDNGVESFKILIK